MKTLNRNVDQAIAYLHTLQGSDLEYKVPYTEQMAQDRKQKKISEVQKRIVHSEKQLQYDHIPAGARRYVNELKKGEA